jgi:RecJ-like exonuclease
MAFRKKSRRRKYQGNCKIVVQKINQKKLIKLSFIISVLGIFLIYLLAINLEPKQVPISSISQKSLEQFVKIQGYVIKPGIIENKSEGYAFTIFKIQDNSGEIEVIFRNSLKLKNLQRVEIIGKVSTYENQLQIESYKIKLLS